MQHWLRPWLTRVTQQRHRAMLRQPCSVSHLPMGRPTWSPSMRSRSGLGGGCLGSRRCVVVLAAVSLALQSAMALDWPHLMAAMRLCAALGHHVCMMQSCCEVLLQVLFMTMLYAHPQGWPGVASVQSAFHCCQQDHQMRNATKMHCSVKYLCLHSMLF